jgi:uncharacterized protein YcbK (DUF882 family)
MNLRYFDISEFDCSHTGWNLMEVRFLYLLDELRHDCGFPFRITSGYRDPSHPEEAKKDKPGMHSKGLAADIKVDGGYQRFLLVAKAIEHGFTGIGVAKTFVHVDLREDEVMWTY